MKKVIISYGAILLLMAAVLTGCGNSSGDTGQTESKAAPKASGEAQTETTTAVSTMDKTTAYKADVSWKDAGGKQKGTITIYPYTEAWSLDYKGQYGESHLGGWYMSADGSMVCTEGGNEFLDMTAISTACSPEILALIKDNNLPVRGETAPEKCVMHKWKDGTCVMCQSVCPHDAWKDSLCTECGFACTHGEHDNLILMQFCVNTQLGGRGAPARPLKRQIIRSAGGLKLLSVVGRGY